MHERFAIPNIDECGVSAVHRDWNCFATTRDGRRRFLIVALPWIDSSHDALAVCNLYAAHERALGLPEGLSWLFDDQLSLAKELRQTGNAGERCNV